MSNSAVQADALALQGCGEQLTPEAGGREGERERLLGGTSSDRLDRFLSVEKKRERQRQR